MLTGTDAPSVGVGIEGVNLPDRLLGEGDLGGGTFAISPSLAGNVNDVDDFNRLGLFIALVVVVVVDDDDC
jgi:hypothetical protein